MQNDRFRARLAMAETEFGAAACWPHKGWTARNGYCMVTVQTSEGPRKVMAHRLAYSIVVGPVPADKVIDHLCRNKKCINPAHLEVVTQRENVRRGTGIASTRMSLTHCKMGHPLEGDNLVSNQRTRRCRTCYNKWMREYRKKHPERVKATDNKRYDSHYASTKLRRAAKRGAQP